MAYQTFENLEVWKRACRQAVTVCRLFSKCSDWTIKDQIGRAALSVPSNIAEGHERDSQADFIRFLRIAKGSNGELRTQLYIAAELEWLSKEQMKPLVQESKEIAAMLQGLIHSMRKPKSAKAAQPGN